MSLCGFLTAFALPVLTQTPLASLRHDVRSVLVPAQGSGNDCEGREPRAAGPGSEGPRRWAWGPLCPFPGGQGLFILVYARVSGEANTPLPWPSD